MWSFFVRHIAMPMASFVTPHKAWKYCREYERADYDDPEERSQRVWQKLKALLEHAYENTEVYRGKFKEAGMTPDDVRSWEDFQRIPILTKQELRESFPERIVAENYRNKRLRFSNTSGTTGKPAILAQDIDDINYKYAVRLRARLLEGSRVGDRTLRTTPNECQPCLESGNVTDKSLWQYFKSQTVHGGRKTPEYFVFLESKIVNPFFHRRIMLPPIGPEAGEMAEKNFEYYLQEMERYKPRIWVTYPLYAYLMAKYVKRTGRAVPHVEVIDLSGGVASSKMRSMIADVFGVPPREGYGGCEFGRYANECEVGHGKVHVVEDHCYVEVLRPDGTPAADGELGNQVVTALTNYAMPTIRLEQGDVAVSHGCHCPCGRTTRLLDLRGRIQTLIVAPDGRTIAEKDILDALLDFPGVEWFQLVQHEESRFELLVVPQPEFKPLDKDGLAEKVRETLGFDALVSVQEVDNIAQERSGKYMHVKSCTYDSFRCVSKEIIERDRYTRLHMH